MTPSEVTTHDLPLVQLNLSQKSECDNAGNCLLLAGLRHISTVSREEKQIRETDNTDNQEAEFFTDRGYR